MRGLGCALVSLIAVVGAHRPAQGRGRTIAPRELQREANAPPRTVKLLPGEQAIHLRLNAGREGRAFVVATNVPGRAQTQLSGRPAKNDSVIFKLTPGRYFVGASGGLSRVDVEAWGAGKQRIRKTSRKSGDNGHPFDYQLLGAPETFPSQYDGRTALHEVGSRRSAGYIYDYQIPQAGYFHVWFDTKHQRAHRLTEVAMKGVTSVERDSYIYLTVFNPSLKGHDAKLPTVSGDVQVVGVSRQQDVFAGFSYLVLKPTKPDGSFKIAEPDLLYESYVAGGSRARFSYRQLP